MKACLTNLVMFCVREKSIGLIAKQQDEKSTKKKKNKYVCQMRSTYSDYCLAKSLLTFCYYIKVDNIKTFQHYFTRPRINYYWNVRVNFLSNNF